MSTTTPDTWAEAKGSYEKERLFLRRHLYTYISSPSGAQCGSIVGHAVGNKILTSSAKATPSYIRDSLHPNVLKALMAGEISMIDVEAAVRTPETHGVKNATGFVFGYPRSLTSEIIEKADKWLDANLGSTPPSGTPAILHGGGSATASEPEAETSAKDNDTVTLNPANAAGPTPGSVKGIKIDPEFASLMDVALSKGTNVFKSANDLIFYIDAVEKSISQVTDELELARRERKMADDLAESLRKRLSAASAGPLGASGTVEIKPSTTEIPDGKVTMVDMSSIFSIGGSLSIPKFEWSGDHPLVPMVDPYYDFDPDNLIKFMFGILSNKKIWLHGHTGTGKTTFVEQVCARLGWPFMRINLDSEITRMDMLGRDTLKADPTTGHTISEFVPGIVPMAMRNGAVLCVDEVSFGRPDVMYVFQRVLEDKGLVLTENGGELVTPSPFFRVVATDNTKGQGDEWGAYQGARAQSGAFLDRFNCWIGFDYMKVPREIALIKNLVPGVAPDAAKLLASVAKEVRISFAKGDILQTMSPRGLVSCAEAIVFLSNVRGKPSGDKETIKEALNLTLIDKASQGDSQVIRGIVDRVLK